MEDVMTDPTYVLLYVDDPARSAAFYTDLIGRRPVENSPTFALFVLGNGAKLGLWKRDDIRPAATGAPGSSEICFALEDKALVTKTHRDWAERGLRIVQEPTDLDFGHTFVALDPDGHRLRVFSPSAR
jgi:catechol 2,3-dioxygenase-like lactoylglutathione lyase family enzyme